MHDIRSAADAAIKRHAFPGCVVGVITNGAQTIVSCGHHTYDASSPSVDEHSLYDCASLTKSVVTATLALQLIGEGKLSLDEKLITHFPAYRTPHREEVTLWHLLTYTLGNSMPLSRAGKSSEEIFDAVCTENTKPPGVVFNYSNTPALLLGFVLEGVIGPLDRAADERIFKPLDMQETTFHPQGSVPTEEGIRDIVHDESARVFSRAGRVVGHAGLFSTVSDLRKLCAHLLAQPDERLCTNQLASIGESASLGWELDQPWMGTKRSPKTFGKTGYTGTSILCDPEERICTLILSNRTYPKRVADRREIDAFRAEIADIVHQ